MRTRVRSSIAISAVILLAACSGNGGGTTDGGGTDGGGTDGTVITDGGGLDGHPSDGSVVTDGSPNNDGGGGNTDGSTVLPDGVTADSGPTIVGNMVYCGGHVCQCSDGIDNDGDGLADNQDPECVSPYDDDESSFATGIPGDNMGSNAMTECFFDGNSGPGNDANCVVPNGCDCRGCCDYDINRNGTHEMISIRDTACHTVTRTATANAEGGPCTPDTDGGMGSCTDAVDHCLLDGDGVTYFCAPCSPCVYASDEVPPIAGCATNPCDTGEVCLGDPPPPADSDAGTPPDASIPPDSSAPDAGTGQRCGTGVTPCATNTDCSGLGAGFFCITGCCYNLG